MSELPKIVRERLAQMPAGPHPDPDLLNAFAEHALAPRERALVLAHVSACQECRQLISLAALPLGDTEVAPPPQAARGWFAWSYMRWSGAVAAVLVVASIALVFEDRWKQPRLDSTVSRVETAKVGSAEPDSGAKPVASSPESPVVTADERLAKRRLEAAPQPSKPAESPAHSPEQGRRDRLEYRAETPAPPPPAPPAGGLVGEARISGVIPAQNAPAEAAAPATAPAAAAATEAKKEKDAKFDELAQMSPSAGKTAETDRQQGAKATEVVDVEAEAQQVESTRAQVATGLPDKQSGDKLSRQAAAPERSRSNTFGLTDAAASWRISSSGALERTTDGRAWKTALTVPDVRFTAVAALGNHVWAGGTGGVVYFTSDNGRRWLHRQLIINGNPVKEDVLAISIDTRASGTVHTSSGSYTTTDGGATWSKVAGQ